MTDQVAAIIEPFVRSGLFATPEKAIAEMARDYTLRQIERYKSVVEQLQTKHGMNYDQFEAYLKSRAKTLVAKPNAALNQAIMLEEEDALDWKVAREMLQKWLGLHNEAHA